MLQVVFSQLAPFAIMRIFDELFPNDLGALSCLRRSHMMSNQLDHGTGRDIVVIATT